MSYFPQSPHITTTEKATGDYIEGKAVFRVMVKHTGNLSTGVNSIAHGIASFTKIVRCEGTIKRDNGETFPLDWHSRTTGSNFQLTTHVTSTNIVITLDSAWTGAGNVLSDPWVVLEYLKS